MHRVLLAEEQPAMRHAIRTLLDQSDYEVVREVSDGLDALSGTLELKPDLLILALRLRRLGGLEVIRRLRRRGETVKILVLTAADSEHFVSLCWQAGATGFVSKQDDLGELTLALQAIARGHTFFPGNAAHPRSGETHSRVESAQIQSLSPREVTVMNYLANGYANGAIAKEMSISDRTVSTYKLRLFRKLKIKSLIELGEVAKRHGLLGVGVMGDTPEVGSITRGLEGAQHALLREVLDAIPSGVFIRDREGRLVFANDSFISSRQQKMDDILGTRFTDLDNVDPLDLAELDRIYQEHVKLGIAFRHDMWVTENGVPRATRFWGAPLRDAEGEAAFMICGNPGIEEQESAFQSLREEKARAEVTHHAYGTLLREHVENSLVPLQEIERALQRLQGELPGSGAGEDVLKRMATAANALRAEFQTLQTLMSIGADLPASIAQSCDLSAFAGRLAERLADRFDGGRPRISFDTTGTRVPNVWLDQVHYCLVVTDLVAPVVTALDADAVELALQSSAMGRALVEVRLDIRCTGTSRGASRRAQRASAINAARDLAKAIQGEVLVMADTDSSVHLQLKSLMPKAAAALGGKR